MKYFFITVFLFILVEANAKPINRNVKVINSSIANRVAKIKSQRKTKYIKVPHKTTNPRIVKIDPQFMD